MQRARVIVPPLLLVRMFGVPEVVTMPKKIGEETTFSAYDKTWRVYRHSGDTWSLSCPLVTPRVRFGNAAEIAEDIGVVLETGVLPGKPGQP